MLPDEVLAALPPGGVRHAAINKLVTLASPLEPMMASTATSKLWLKFKQWAISCMASDMNPLP